MLKRLTRHGNSYALVIDKPILDLLNMDPEGPVEISTDGRTLVITPVTDTQRRKKFEAALKKTNEKFGRTLKKLAE